MTLYKSKKYDFSMKNVFLLSIIFLFTVHPVRSQDIASLLKDDYDRQSQLLIQNEIRKSLGSRANSKEVQLLVKNLLPWSQMEGFSPKQFARSVEYLDESARAGIPFESNEELLPLVANFAGSKEEFLYLSRFMREAEEANLPEMYRDDFIGRGLDNRWEALSVLVAGRLLILSRQENIDTKEYFDLLIHNMNPKFSKLSQKASEDLISKLSQNFKNQKNINSIQKLNQDAIILKASKGDKVTENLKLSSRNLDPLFEEYGRLEVRRRPQVRPEDIGIEPIQSTTQPTQTTKPPITQQPTVKPPTAGTTPTLNQGERWKRLSTASLYTVVNGWIGTRYKFGGNTKAGVDCSGFTLHVLIDPKIGVPKGFVPRRATPQASLGSLVQNRNMQAGDLVFFSASPNQTKITHVGLVMKNRDFSHASSTRGVVIQSLDSKWWKERYVTSRRIFSQAVD
ncbi:MAG: C40 family peptidase [Leptospira sp.]|nr:C40 family peptidase [Leptospira sp.]